MRLVHLAPASAERGIRRAGLRGTKVLVSTSATSSASVPRAVHAMPVVADFWTTFQWLRELRRGHDDRLTAVYFRIPDREHVYVGRYNEPHASMVATRAADWVRKNPAGAQVIVPRSVPVTDVLGVRRVTQLVGWTSVPEASRRWDCVCSACLPAGDRNLMRRIRGAFAASLTAARRARAVAEVQTALWSLEKPVERGRDRLDHTKLLVFGRSTSPEVRRATARLLGYFAFRKVRETLQQLTEDPHIDVRHEAVESMTRSGGAVHAAKCLQGASSGELRFFVELLQYESDVGVAVEILEGLVHHSDTKILVSIQETSAALLSGFTGAGSTKRRLEKLARGF